MEQSDTAKGASETFELAGLIARDAGRLLDQHVHLVGAELHRELRAVPAVAASIGAGAGLAAVGGGMGALMLVHALHRFSRLPLWGCYGLVGSVLAATGSCLLVSGTRKAASISLLPRESLGALREDVAWIKNQLTDSSS